VKAHIPWISSELTVTNDSCAVVLLLLLSRAKSRGQLGTLAVRSKQEWVEVVFKGRPFRLSSRAALEFASD
jgi:hypothetical protein